MGVVTTIKDKVQGKVPSGTQRSDKWPTVRKAYLKDHPTCAVCGGTSKLEVHHKMPFHLHPELELDPTNFITLCESTKHGINCHLLVGHLGDFHKYNPSVDQDASTWNTKLNSTNVPTEDAPDEDSTTPQP